MICDAMVHADKTLGISAATQSAEDFQFLTDHIVHVRTFVDPVAL